MFLIIIQSRTLLTKRRKPKTLFLISATFLESTKRCLGYRNQLLIEHFSIIKMSSVKVASVRFGKLSSREIRKFTRWNRCQKHCKIENYLELLQKKVYPASWTKKSSSHLWRMIFWSIWCNLFKIDRLCI